jgi:hypothetical protein
MNKLRQQVSALLRTYAPSHEHLSSAAFPDNGGRSDPPRTGRPSQKSLMYRWRVFRPEGVRFLLALLALSLIGWAARDLLHMPYVGATWSWTSGVVEAVDLNGPLVGRLHPGDVIRSIDGASVPETRQAPRKQVGESMQFVVQDGGAFRKLSVQLPKAPLAVFLRDTLPLLIALAFWLLGLAVALFTPEGTQKSLAFLFAQAMSATLAAGAMSWFGPLWVARLFGVLLWWIGPLTFLFHLHFPAQGGGRGVRRRTYGLFGVALLGSLLEVLVDPVAMRVRAPGFFTIRLLWLAACLLAAIAVLVRTYRRTPSPRTRRRIGLIALGGITGFLPLLTLSLLPDALLGRPLLPYEGAFLFLLIVPLFYSYAIFRYRLLPIDRYISRVAATALVIALLGGMYLLVYAAALRLLPAPIRQHPLMALLFALLVGLTAGPAHRRLQAVVNNFLYGGWYDYRSVVQQVSQTLGSTKNDHEFARNLCVGVQAAMQLEWAGLLLAGDDGALHMAGFAGDAHAPPGVDAMSPEVARRLGALLRKEPRTILNTALCEACDGADFSSAERRLLRCEQTTLWAPLMAGEQLLGVLIVGPKRGSGDFNRTDRQIIEVVGRQVSIALENARLSAELGQHAAESERLHHEIMDVRDAERARIARAA